MNPTEMNNLVGKTKFLIPLNNYNLYFKVKIIEAKREFGHVLTKIEPEETKDFDNVAWVRLDTLKNKVDKIRNRS